MRYKSLLRGTIILFLLVNTSYYWERILGGWNLLSMLLCAISFLILLTGVIRQLLYWVIRERLKNKARVYPTVIVVILLGLIAAKPDGIIDFEKFGSKNLFVAWQEGVANCTTTLILKENRQFYLRSICFGYEMNWGNYSVSNDTIKLKFSFLLDGRARNYEFGVYKPYSHPKGKPIGEIRLYTSAKDTLPYLLQVYKNELIKYP